MKFFLSVALILHALLASFTLAEIIIEQPPSGTSVPAGSQFVVQVEQPDSIQGPIEVALIIGLQTCATVSCPPGQLGSILYNGPFNPTFHPGPGEPYQNFSVTVPGYFDKGAAVLNVVNVGLWGAGAYLSTETVNITLNIV